MQFHHFGYVSHDPRIKQVEGVGATRSEELPDKMDVLIVGAGPAGMIAAAQLSMFPNVDTRIIERRPQRLELGKADGIQSRSVETFQAFGFANEITDEAYQITEMSFWNKDPNNPKNIIRTGRPIDDEFGISEFPHLIVNQARVLDYFADFMKQSPTRMTPDFGWDFISLEIDPSSDAEYPVTVSISPVTDPSVVRTVRAKYVIGCDGARSKVRKSIGRKLEGNQANHAWGVMDVVTETDFPDLRTKCAIHAEAGSILLIPREGGYLCRFYVDLGEVTPEDAGKVRETPLEEIIRQANAILHPYSIEVKETAWHSVYEVGHRLVDAFDDAQIDSNEHPKVFLTGDACHTHSAKAGQGMNVSMQDGFNIGWKLGQVLSGIAVEDLLKTYSGERQPAAENLINFDREWSTLMATPPEELEDPSSVERYYVQAEEFAAGFRTEYPPNLITSSAEYQELATGYPIGKRFKSHVAMRRCDANVKHIGHLHTADGRWRIYVFADKPAPKEDSKANDFAQWWSNDPASPLLKYTPADACENSVFDLKVIYQQYYHDFECTEAPAAFRPKVGPYKVSNWENVFSAHAAEDIFDGRGISRDGAIVVVRPDQYVGAVFPLDKYELLAEYFGKFMVEQA